ncbi:Clp protease N-terminal domain-containing protein [Fodinicola acaciae]|uniref:Clp protease N-terminal domain-containing protein n=1 Tax=Fodinicola acaciae TaxID=2681555 RepID=UPI0013D2C23B|nr:Clp protease N-terminal domain-containing protein [Fodinicola acaciae]
MVDAYGGKQPFTVVMKAALHEARRRGDRRLGTEHLLLGLLHAPESAPAKALGVDLSAAREALDELDRAALLAIGIDTRDFQPVGQPPLGKRPPVSSAARAILGKAVGATTLRTRRLAPKFLLKELLATRSPDPAADLLASMHIDKAYVLSALEKSN